MLNRKMLVLGLLSVAGVAGIAGGAHAQASSAVDLNTEIDRFMVVYRPAEDLQMKLYADWQSQVRDGRLSVAGRQCLKDGVTLDLLNQLVRPMFALYIQDADLLHRVNDFYATPAGRDLRTFEIAQAKKIADDAVAGKPGPALRPKYPPAEAAQISAWKSGADFKTFSQLAKGHESATPDIPADVLGQMKKVNTDCHALQ